MRDRVALVLTFLTAAFHLAVASRYDVLRDELCFIVCGRQPAFGYADQPPLVPLLAAGAYALDGQTWVVRWGLRGQDPENVLRVQSNPERLRPYCAQMRELGTTQSRYARGLENGKTIAFCRGVHPSLAKLWPSLKVFI